jgi:glycosyltransferase involved in cell wall biosynthesis
MPPISVVICANVPERLEAACESARWADDVLVVDSGDRRETACIAARAGARHLRQPWLGYTGQARFAVAQARHAWVLLLDQDEECSPELAREIRSLDGRALEQHAMFSIPRRHFMFGRVVRSWEPDRAGRFLHRERTTWADERLHERCTPLPGGRVGLLRGRLLHRREGDSCFQDFFDGAGTDHRLPLALAQLRHEGKACRWYYLALGPIAEFLKFYVLRLGFLDGKFGVLIAYKAAFAEHLRSASLWAAEQGIGSHPRGS